LAPRKRKIIKWLVITVLIGIFLFNSFAREMPDNTSYKGKLREVESIEFIYDLTYLKDGRVIHEQDIFERILEEISRAGKFIIIDMFLFNDDYDRAQEFPPLAQRLTRALVDKKKQDPGINIVYITDPINTFYGSYSSKYLDELEGSGIKVIITDLDKIREPNPLYAGFWRTFIRWAGTGKGGWLPNPFSPDSPKVNLRSYLKLLNFKANHRKVLVTEKSAVVTSFNPHDASAYHSNIAFAVRGNIINDLIETEKAVAEFSGHRLGGDFKYLGDSGNAAGARAAVLTEGKIREELVKELRQTKEGDEIKMAMFYLADRVVIDELLKAAGRGVDIRIVLDPNKDAFGRKKNGIPNRQAAYELVKESGGKIKVRWYDTHGEQFHSKMVIVRAGNRLAVFGGSANLTRRNIADYNLETDLKVVVPAGSPLAVELTEYFDRIWFNEGGHYTVDYENFKETSLWKWALYLFQEWSGLSTF